MDIIADWIAERHPLDARRMELFKLPQERGEKEIMAMVFITHCRSPQFRKELHRHGVGVTWQFIRKEVQGWDRSQ